MTLRQWLKDRMVTTGHLLPEEADRVISEIESDPDQKALSDMWNSDSSSSRHLRAVAWTAAKNAALFYLLFTRVSDYQRLLRFASAWPYGLASTSLASDLGRT